MAVLLPNLDADDADFVNFVQRLLVRAVERLRPDRVWVAHVDNWFGPNWYGFQGKVVGALGIHLRRTGDFTMPPFVPGRILCETCYALAPDGDYKLFPDAPRMSVPQRSERNQFRHLDRFTSSGVLFWYSGNTARQDKGSAMLYVNTPQVSDAWYASLAKDGHEWRFLKGMGITAREVEEIGG